MAKPPRYEYLLEVEQSGSARSYLAIDRFALAGNRFAGEGRPDPLVVVHMAPPAIARDENLRSEFATRAATLLSLQHPNLVRVLDYAAESRWCYWVSEAVLGQPLSRLLAKRDGGARALSLREIVVIARDVALGLEHAHAALDEEGAPRPIAHRNLCPASVLVSYGGAVKLSDGVSCGSPEVTTGPLEHLVERLGYLAPECCSGGVADARADVYAVGALVWEAVADRRRVFGATLQESIEMRLQGTEPELDQVCPEAPAGLVALTRRALAADPAARHQSAAELRLELEGLLSSDELGPHAEGGSLLGFMGRHFAEDHAALVALLEARGGPLLGALAAQRSGPEAGGGETAAEPAAADGSRAPALGSAPPPAPELSDLPSPAPAGKKRRVAPWLLASAALVTVLAVALWPEPEPPTETAVQGLVPNAPSATSGQSPTPGPARGPARAEAPVPGASAATPPAPGSGEEQAARARSAAAAGGEPAPRAPSDEARAAVPPRSARARSLDDRSLGNPALGNPARTAPPLADPAPERPRRPRVRRTPELTANGLAAPGASRGASAPAAGEALSALEGRAGDPGLDLRARERRAPRAIDKENPYSP